MRMSELITLGLGATLLAKDKMEETLDHMLARGEQGKGEARGLRDRAEARWGRECARCEARFKDKAREVVRELGLATREDVEAAVRAKD